MPISDVTAYRTVARALTRRSVFGVLAAGPFLLVPGFCRAQGTDIGAVQEVVGEAFARLTSTRRLAIAQRVFLGDLVWTGAASRVAFELGKGTRLFLGSRSRLAIDRFVADSGAELVLGEGALVFDRGEDLPKADATIRTSFGLIAVRGTRLFAGPSRGRFGVFVERGAVEVTGGGVLRRVAAGYGVDVEAPGRAPSVPVRWGAARIAEAFASVLG